MTTSEQVTKSVLYMPKTNEKQENIQLTNLKPQLLLDEATPRLIDKWQIAPKLWDVVRFEVDHRSIPRQFVLTGSAVPADRSPIFHSSTERITRLKIRTMSLFESGESNGQVSLKNLFDGETEVESKNDLSLENIAFLICQGNWPTALAKPEHIALG